MIGERILLHAPAILGVFVVTLLCYAVTLPDAITLEDAGLFQMICHNGGLGHPPGYPLFVLSCQQFVDLPFFDQSVFAANLLSALFASAACALLYLIANDILDDRWTSGAVSVCFGLSMTFWSQAIIVEVYSLAVLMFMVCACFAMRFREQGKFSDLAWLAFFFGLALSNHWPLHLLATPALIALIYPRWQDLFSMLLTPSKFLIVVAVGLLGLLPYLSLFQQDPAFAVFGGVASFEEFVRYVSRSAYSDHSELAGWRDRVSYQSWLLLQSVKELHIVPGILAILGLIRSFRVLSVSMAAALVLLYLGGTSVLILLLGFEFNEFRQAIFSPYSVIAFSALAIWMGLGLQWVVSHVAEKYLWLGKALPLAVCLLTFMSSYPVAAGAGNGFAEGYAEMVLEQVPEGAVLFVEGDAGVGLIGYLHYVRGDRPDIELRSWNNLVFPNRLLSPMAPRRLQDEARQSFIDSSESPVFSTSHDEGALNLGLVFQHKVAPGYRRDTDIREFIEYLAQLELTGVLRNAHERDLLFQILSVLTHQYLALQLLGETIDPEETRQLDTLQTTLPGKFVTLQAMAPIAKDEAGKARLRGIGEQAFSLMLPTASREHRGLLAAYRGQVELQGQADLGAAKSLLEDSVRTFPSQDNPGVCLLKDTYRQLGLQSGVDPKIKMPEAVTCE